MKISMGTRSVLFGVHQFLFHPLCVALAWRRLYRRWPCWYECLAILLHDSPGYWGCQSMDGPDGIQHPQRGARWAAKIAGIFSEEAAFKTYFLTLYHSGSFAKLHGAEPSDLHLPDKGSILMEPKWWYMFRARCSGEIKEYVKNSPHRDEDDWYLYYTASVQRKLNDYVSKYR